MVARLLSSSGFDSAALAENSSAFGQDVPPILCRSNAAATSKQRDLTHPTMAEGFTVLFATEPTTPGERLEGEARP
jgi:hypothetical protein